MFGKILILNIRKYMFVGFNYAMQVNVTVGETVVLVCSLITDDSSVQWIRMDLKVIYSNGDLVNPNLLNQTRYDVIGNQEIGEFNFQIKQVMKYDEGIHDTNIEGKAVSEVISLNVYGMFEIKYCSQTLMYGSLQMSYV